MIINICCSGSSGSTMLSNILNRHTEIFSGEESAVFSKPTLYKRFAFMQRFSFFISRYGISSAPYFADRSIFRNFECYGLSKNVVWEVLKDSVSFVEFVNNLKAILLKIKKKKIWAEKTPTNILTIKYFLNYFPSSKVIHIVRDPRDVVLSLMARGLSKEAAADVWLSAVSSIQPFIRQENVYEIRYEDLVENPRHELHKLCEFVGVDFQEDMLSSDGNRCHIDSWVCNPNEKISSKSLEKYKKSKVNFDSIYSMKITKYFADLQQVSEYYLIDLMKSYGYEVGDIDFEGFINKEKFKLDSWQPKEGCVGKLLNNSSAAYSRVEL